MIRINYYTKTNNCINCNQKINNDKYYSICPKCKKHFYCNANIKIQTFDDLSFNMKNLLTIFAEYFCSNNSDIKEESLKTLNLPVTNNKIENIKAYMFYLLIDNYEKNKKDSYIINSLFSWCKNIFYNLSFTAPSENLSILEDSAIAILFFMNIYSEYYLHFFYLLIFPDYKNICLESFGLNPYDFPFGLPKINNLNFYVNYTPSKKEEQLWNIAAHIIYGNTYYEKYTNYINCKLAVYNSSIMSTKLIWQAPALIEAVLASILIYNNEIAIGLGLIIASCLLFIISALKVYTINLKYNIKQPFAFINNITPKKVLIKKNDIINKVYNSYANYLEP